MWVMLYSDHAYRYGLAAAEPRLHALFGFTGIAHSNHHIPLFVSFVDIAVGLGNLIKGITEELPAARIICKLLLSWFLSKVTLVHSVSRYQTVIHPAGLDNLTYLFRRMVCPRWHETPHCLDMHAEDLPLAILAPAPELTRASWTTLAIIPPILRLPCRLWGGGHAISNSARLAIAPVALVAGNELYNPIP